MRAVLVILGQSYLNPCRVLSVSFLQGLASRDKRICNRFGILLIADEVQTGFGRTSKMFAVEYWDVTPDIMTIAKGIGGGIPLGGVLTTDQIAEGFLSRTTPTSADSPVACQAGLAYIETQQEQGICDNASEMGG